MEVKLVIASGSARERVLPLPATVFVIGRASQCHLRLGCPEVSELQCAIACWAGKVVVRDLNSAHGTFINGQRVRGEMRVQDGDTLRVGSLSFTFRIKRADGLPIQVVHAGDLRWLLETPSGTLDPTGHPETDPVDLAPLLDSPDPNVPPATADSTALAAGQYLHDYLRQRKTPT